MGEQAEVRAAICSHVFQSEISHHFQSSYTSSADRSKSAITSCLRQAIDTVKRSSLVASSDQSVQDAYNLYVEKILNVAVEPEKIWDDNHTVDQYLNSLLNLQSSRSRNSSNKAVCPIPEASEGEDSAISTWIDGIKVSSKDVKSDTWPTTKTRPSQM
ncbi:hypothetical protein L486_01389 [Kwoniella mangroviensis CBS 10435]|uniref:Uncharacterized protein n=1 Tax=Kwoniella mangroviensis CBS 10435 TaxID=1331196 RepID=A0A1B9J1V8_9TREE|nr:hypothetical protein L486_01389 [Kwoniella mangroviensis CBS 10435]